MTTGTKTTTLWIGTQPEPDDRTQIEVSEQDLARLPSRGTCGSAIVTDQKTGEMMTIRSSLSVCFGICEVTTTRPLGRYP